MIKEKIAIKKQLRMFRTIVFSRHPTHNVLRNQLPLLPFRSVIRLGSTTQLSQAIQSKGKFVECNSVIGIQQTSNKIFMKQAFTNAGISSPIWFVPIVNVEVNPSVDVNHVIQVDKNLPNPNSTIKGTTVDIDQLKYPLIGKINYHSRGRGMIKIDDPHQLRDLLSKPLLARKYTFEQYTSFVREYRVHATQKGIFYICRKLRKEDAKERWYFNSKNSIFEITFEDGKWIKDPILCFKAMEADCIKALKALSMDIAGFDIRVNSRGELFTIIEANSACSFGEHTAQHYIKQIPEILKEKFNNGVKTSEIIDLF